MTYIIQKKLRYLETFGRLSETKNYIQHGSISVYTHCVNVARMSVKIAKTNTPIITISSLKTCPP